MTLIITICILILVAYVFDLTSKHTKIPTVLLLIILGWGMHQLTDFFAIQLPDLSPLVPLFGNIGLILIVLEGGLDLEFNKNKLSILRKTSLAALIPLIALFLIIGFGFNYYFGSGLLNSFINAIPFCIISSAIAIPSVQNLSKDKKEFITYESSLSDIFGVILFNFFTTNDILTGASVGHFFLQIAIILVISFVFSVGLAYLIKRIDHHVKFIPIILMVVLVYAVAETYHLPALVFILIFGIFLNNLDEVRKVPFLRKLEAQKLDNEVHRFRELVGEITFLVRTIFFLLFGYSIDTSIVYNTSSMLLAAEIVGIIFLIRFIQLKLSKIPLLPLLFIAPRGLITILLFISIPAAKTIPFITESLMIQIVIFSSLVLMIGMLFSKKQTNSAP